MQISSQAFGKSWSAPSNTALQPEASVRTSRHIRSGFVVGVAGQQLRIVLLGHHTGISDDPVLRSRGQWIVHISPGKVHAILVLGCRRKAETCDKAVGQRVKNGKQSRSYAVERESGADRVGTNTPT